MRTRFQQALDELRQRLLLMGGLAEQAVDRGCRAYTERDLTICHTVLEGESQINAAERETFAKKFAGVSAIRIKQLSDPDPNYEDILREGKDVSNTVGLIAPNGIRRQIINVSNGAKMTKENLEELKAPTVVILVFGKITYEDIFRCSHWTIYCYRGYIDGTWETYGSYNDADEDYCP